MVFPALKRLVFFKRAGQVLTLILISVFSIFLILVLWTSVYNLYLFFFLTAVILFCSVFTFHHFQSKTNNLFAELENKAFGSRKLLLDSLWEFKIKKQFHPDFYSEMDNDKPLTLVLKQFKNKMLGQNILLLFLVCFFTTGFIFHLHASQMKLNLFKEFQNRKLVSTVPAYYPRNKAFEIALDQDAAFFDTFKVSLNHNPAPYSNKTAYLPPSDGNILLLIQAEKFGIQRTVYSDILLPADGVFPETVQIEVVYPDTVPGFEISPGIENTMQDLDVFPGAQVKISGKASIELTNARLTFENKESGSFSAREFSGSFNVQKNGFYRLFLSAEIGTPYISPEYAVKIKPNQPPVLQLLYPAGNIHLRSSDWKVRALYEASDDQGLAYLVTSIKITNSRKDMERYNREQTGSQNLSGALEARPFTEWNQQNLELYPGDTAEITAQAADVFNTLSRPVRFQITAPSLDELSAELDQSADNARQNLSGIQKAGEAIQKAAGIGSKSGMNDAASSYEKSEQNLEDNVASMKENGLYNDLPQAKDVIARMEAVLKSLKENGDKIRELSKLMDSGKAGTNVAALSPDALLQALENLLSRLDSLKTSAELLSRMNEVKKAYNRLKTENETRTFNRSRAIYQNALKNLSGKASASAKELADQLQKESAKLNLSQPESFEPSDKLLNSLEQQIQKDLQDSDIRKTEEARKVLKRSAQELYLSLLVLNIFLFPKDNAGISKDNGELVRAGNAILASLKETSPAAVKALSDIGAYEAAVRMDRSFRNFQQITENFQQKLRDRNTDEALGSLDQLRYGFGIIILELIDADKAAGSQQGKTGASQALNLQDLQKMQSGISQELSRLLSQGNNLSAKDRKILSDLAKLQDEILKEFQKFSGQGNGALASGGAEKDMADLSGQMQSGQISDKTLEKSKQIEEKLLKAKKSIQTQGVNNERKAEAAQPYEAVPPSELLNSLPEGINLEDTDESTLPQVYRNLLKRYREILNQNKGKK